MMEFSSWTPDFFIQNENECREILTDLSKWKEIPFLNYVQLQYLPDNTLVRFRGMIQNMLDPEYYLERYDIETGNGNRTQNGKYRDTLVFRNKNECLNHISAENVHGERRTMFVVSVPGLNSWSMSVEKNGSNSVISIKGKNTDEESQSQKRSHEEDDSNMEPDQINYVNIKLKTNAQGSVEANPNVLSQDYLLNSPISDRPSKACMIKIYSEFEKYTLNSIIDVVGFLSVDPSLDATNDEPSEYDDIREIYAQHPPPSLIPRLHAVFIRQLKQINPLLDESFTTNVNTEYVSRNAEEISKDILMILTQCLFEDRIAAQYFFCHLLSSIYIRTDMETLGQFSLNISHIPPDVLPEYTKMLYNILELFLPASHYFPMTLDNINNLQFAPKKDYTTNKLVSGILQLAPHTHLVIDETRLEPGKLNSTGIEAVNSINHLINHQKLKCDFKFYQIDYDVDVPVLILSEGKSMLHSNFHIPLKPDQRTVAVILETITAAKQFIKTKADLIREFLSFMRHQKFEMESNESEIIQEDFVTMRRKFNATVDDLHSLLVLSRLIGLSKGKLILDRECWDIAKSMEIARKSRISSLPRRK